MPYLSYELRSLTLDIVGIPEIWRPGCGKISKGVISTSGVAQKLVAVGISSNFLPLVEATQVNEPIMQVSRSTP